MDEEGRSDGKGGGGDGEEGAGGKLCLGDCAHTDIGCVVCSLSLACVACLHSRRTRGALVALCICAHWQVACVRNTRLGICENATVKGTEIEETHPIEEDSILDVLVECEGYVDTGKKSAVVHED